MTFYNENDAYPAAWLRGLIEAGHISPGVVDERSIADLQPEDLHGYERAHFFAGIAGWDYALRLAGWPDDAPVWTGSCPCQPFSVAGKRRGAEDDRHLWPAWFRLIRECRPVCVFGEQVDSKDGRAWLDAVCADLEGAGYTVGAAFLPAASVGAPHGRPRTYFGAHAEGFDGSLLLHERRSLAAGAQSRGSRGTGFVRSDTFGERDGDDRRGSVGGPVPGVQGAPRERERLRPDARLGGADGDACSDTDECAGRQGRALNAGRDHRSDAGEGAGPCCGGRAGFASADAYCERRCGRELRDQDAADAGEYGEVVSWRGFGWLSAIEARSLAEAGATRGFWGGCDWWWGRDGKARPIGPGLFPLAHGVPARVGRLRAYGNAIVPQVAAEFVMAYMESVRC